MYYRVVRWIWDNAYGEHYPDSAVFESLGEAEEYFDAMTVSLDVPQVDLKLCNGEITLIKRKEYLKEYVR